MNSNKESTPKTSNEYVKIISELKIAKTNINKTVYIFVFLNNF